MPNREDSPRDRDFDAALGHALRDVRTPPGLQERVLARSVVAERAVLARANLAHKSPTRGAKRFVRRWAIAAVTSVAAAVALSTFGLSHLRGGVDVEEVIAKAADALSGLGERSLTRASPPRDLPISSFVAVRGGEGWCWLNQDFFGHKAVAYVLSRAHDARAALIVADRRGAVWSPRFEILTGAPSNPRSSSLATAAAWCEGNCLYVLWVEGDARRFDGWIAKRPDLAARIGVPVPEA